MATYRAFFVQAGFALFVAIVGIISVIRSRRRFARARAMLNPNAVPPTDEQRST